MLKVQIEPKDTKRKGLHRKNYCKKSYLKETIVSKKDKITIFKEHIA